MTVFGTLFLALLAYSIATGLFIVITQLSLLPQGPLWDPSFRGPVIFILLIIVLSVLLVPLFMRDVDPAVRTLSSFTVLVLVAYAALHQLPAFDPERPMRFIVSHVFTPFQIWSGGR